MVTRGQQRFRLRRRGIDVEGAVTIILCLNDFFFFLSFVPILVWLIRGKIFIFLALRRGPNYPGRSAIKDSM